MPRMTSCLNFTCVDCNPLPNLPTSKTVTRAIFSICSEMDMDGCNNCKISGNTSTYSECDLLGTFSKLCRAMPDMRQCDSWNQMCSASPGIKLCDSYSKDSPPVMKMYFHGGFKDYILFENAVPVNYGTYSLAIMVVFIFAMLYEGYQILHFKVLDIIANQVDNTVKTQIKTAFLRGITRLIGAMWTYALMLIAMTFNIGLFLSVIFGLAFGSAVFGSYLSKLQEKRLVDYQTEELCC
jgi:copper transporter 1